MPNLASMVQTYKRSRYAKSSTRRSIGRLNLCGHICGLRDDQLLKRHIMLGMVDGARQCEHHAWRSIDDNIRGCSCYDQCSSLGLQEKACIITDKKSQGSLHNLWIDSVWRDVSYLDTVCDIASSLSGQRRMNEADSVTG